MTVMVVGSMVRARQAFSATAAAVQGVGKMMEGRPARSAGADVGAAGARSVLSAMERMA